MAIAIVSAGIRFPGARSMDEFWTILRDGTSLLRPVSPERWPAPAETFQAREGDGIAHDRLYEVSSTRESAEGLATSQAALDGLDPLFHLTIGAGREAYFQAKRQGIEKQRMGVILGSIALPTSATAERSFNWLQSTGEIDLDRLPQNARDPRNNSPAAGTARILAEALELGGIVYTLDAACASSLYALRLACDALERGEQDFMLAGGVSRPFSLYTQIGFSSLGALSASARCSALDAEADGLLVGEGAGIFGLKRLADAERDGDEILGVIQGIGLSNDREGRLMAPSSEGQLRAMKAAYEQAGWQIDDVDLIECHATGTPLGDATEIASLQKLWEGARPEARAVLGSVKPNVGHMLTAAGAAGLAKLLLSLREKTLAPTANYHSSPERWGLAKCPFRILQKAEPWRAASGRPRRAALSGFGFGGINAHLLLEEYQAQQARPVSLPSPREVVVVAVSTIDGIHSELGEAEEDSRVSFEKTAEGDLALKSFRLAYTEFKVAPLELQEVLAQQILGLLAVDRLGLRSLAPEITKEMGCFVGLELDAATNLFASGWISQNPNELPYPTLRAPAVIGSLGSIVASRIARELRCGAASFTISAREQSGLQALATAQQQIAGGHLRGAFVLGLDLLSSGRARAQVNEEFASAYGPLADRALAFCLMEANMAKDLGLKAILRLDALETRLQGDVETGKGKNSPGLKKTKTAYYHGAADGLAAFMDHLQTAAGQDQAASFSYRGSDGSRSDVRYEFLSKINLLSAPPIAGASFEIGRWDAPFEPQGSQPDANRNESIVEQNHLLPRNPSAWLESFLAAEAAQIQSHEEFLRYRNEGDALLLKMLQEGTSFAEAEGTPKLQAMEERQKQTSYPLYDYAACREFARGSIAKVFGSSFAEVDSFPTRVRLPDDRLLLCQRVMALEGDPKSLGSGRIVTEHDVLPGAWYLENGQMPTSIAVESGQADLMLAAFLGADFHTRGEAVYRLLDARVSFHRHLPRVGETVRYHIQIKRFFEQGGLLFFHFGFEAEIAGEAFMSMSDGCAGFFTQAALDAGRGVKRSPLQLKPSPGKRVGGFKPFPPQTRLQLSDSAVDAIRRGDYAAGFGPSFAGLPIKNPAGLPDQELRLVQRIVELDPEGGRYGCGRIVGEADIEPEAWFLTCHFIDDQVMPGTLMYECCLQTLRILLMRLGWVAEAEDFRCEPLKGLWSQLKCRGQVLSSTQKVRYDIEIKEIGYGPHAYVICDALMSADGREIVDISDMSLSLPDCNETSFATTWSQQTQPAYANSHIEAFAAGNPSDCFGEVYADFDTRRKIARLPRAPYKFLDGISWVNGPFMEQHVGTQLSAFYEPPLDAWYWEAGGGGLLPFAVLVEIALQPCGFMAAYMGSALLSAADLSFRNLGGEAKLFQEIHAGSGTLWTDVRCSKISRNGDMILQDYHFSVRNVSGVVYEGTTSFGFFTREALGQQVGLRQQQRWQEPQIPIDQAYPEHPALPRAPLLMVESLARTSAPAGRYEQGIIYGRQPVRKGEWFFAAHFYQDPVMPGSLGLEALEQVLKAEAQGIWPDVRAWTLALAQVHRWTYRGQVLPSAQELNYEVHIKAIDHNAQSLKADAWLYCDGLAIYALEDFVLQPELQSSAK